MGIEHYGESIKWTLVRQFVADHKPVSKWYDEESGELVVATNTAWGDYSDKTNHSFNLLYDALRGELPECQRELTDRLYAMFHWWDRATASLTPLPPDLKTQVNDLEYNDDVGVVNGILSPESVKEAHGYAAKIDFERIAHLVNAVYANPENWQNSNRIPSSTKCPLAVNDWKHQSRLIEFDNFNRFFGAADALGHAMTWVELLSKTAAKGEGFILTAS